MRRILHIDMMAAFFSSVEQKRHSELVGKPVVVGGDGESMSLLHLPFLALIGYHNKGKKAKK